MEILINIVVGLIIFDQLQHNRQGGRQHQQTL